MQEIKAVRCVECNKLLYRMMRVDKNHVGYKSEDKEVKPSDLINKTIECKCPRCGAMNQYIPENI